MYTNIYFLKGKVLGELDFGNSSKTRHIFKFYESLQRYLQIAYQRSPHIDSRIRTHDLMSYKLTP